MRDWSLLSALVADALQRNSGRIILAALAGVLLLLVPLLLLEPGEEASQEPPGEVFDLRAEITDRFPSPLHETFFVAESPTGDVLTQGSLWELYRNTERLRRMDEEGLLHPRHLPAQPYFHEQFSVDLGRTVKGVYTLADAVQEVLAEDHRFDTSLADATDEEVKLALHYLLSDTGAPALRDSLSIQAREEQRTVAGEEVSHWTSPALVFSVQADNDLFGGGAVALGATADQAVHDKEEFDLNLQRVLRGGEETYRLWGVAIDLEQESERQGEQAGTFIVLTVVVMLAIVGVAFRSYWIVALTGGGLGILMIWLKGMSNLIGLKGGLVIELIVPIAMISLGVDFAVHALHRYRSQRRMGVHPRQAFSVGLGRLLPALLLAMLSTAIAFLATTVSAIESVTHFGIAAAIAVLGSFLVLGVLLPLVLMRVELLGPPAGPAGWPGRLGAALGAVAASAGYAVGIVLLVALDPGMGAGIVLSTAALAVGVPMLALYLRSRKAPPRDAPVSRDERAATGAEALSTAAVFAWLARRPRTVLAGAGVVTVAAAALAFQLQATFDAKDFLDQRSDFIVSLDKMDEHIGETSGEPALIYIEGDLTDGQALAEIDRLLERLADNPYVARRASGDLDLERPTILMLLRQLAASDFARARAEDVTGVTLDAGEDFLAQPGQLSAAYEYMLAHGVPLSEDSSAYTADQVREVLSYRPGGAGEGITTVTVTIPGAREQQRVMQARQALMKDMAPLGESSAIGFTGLTGSPFVREATLDATSRALQYSLPISAGGVLLLLLVVTRSLRYAVVTVVPMGLVVAWLYGVMYVAGFALNFVTATIAAVSIGVGVDYAVHITQRFREELRQLQDRQEALQRTLSGTGMALLISAVTSIVGFAIMGFAPMPLFASYGMLTALMIAFAAVASLIVLPSLLVLGAPRASTTSHEAAEPVAVSG